MKNYKIQNIGSLNELNQYTFSPEGAPFEIEGKLFLGGLLGLTSMEVSLNKESPGTGIGFFHRHHNNEELYIFISGNGEMQIDDEILSVKEGSTVRVQPEAKRAWWNTGKDDLIFFVIQAPSGGLNTSALEDGEIIEGSVPWA